MFKKWVLAVSEETVFRVWAIISIASTLTTFVFPQLPSHPGLVVVASLAIGVAWASFNLFVAQQKMIASLSSQIEALAFANSKPKLVTAQRKSSWYGRCMNGIRNGDFDGVYLEFNLLVENNGNRNSVVSKFDVSVAELNLNLENVSVEEGVNFVATRLCNLGLHPNTYLTKGQRLQVRAETATDPGIVLVFIPNLNLETFINAGFKMQTDERRLGDLHCRLTITDNNGASDAADFVLYET